MTERNAIILAAGTSSRFVPLSSERPKGLLEVKSEILIERQIRQLKEAGVNDICLVLGYKANMFDYLRKKYGLDTVINEDFERYNNTSSMIRVKDRLANTFICSSDNYFPKNVFMPESEHSFYSACYAEGLTSEYCMATDDNGFIKNVSIGGENAWYMIGHAYFNQDFSKAFQSILTKEYENEYTRCQYWEDVYIRHIGTLPLLKINKYAPGGIEEFDTLDELRDFDRSYIEDTRSAVIKDIADRLNCPESELTDFSKIQTPDKRLSFYFRKGGIKHSYDSGTITQL